MTRPKGALTMETWPSYVEQCKREGQIKFWWIYNETCDPQISEYNFWKSHFEEEWLGNLVENGNTPLFPNYWFAYAYCLQMRAGVK